MGYNKTLRTALDCIQALPPFGLRAMAMYALLFTSAHLTGCAFGTTPKAKSLVTTCVLPTEQAGTLAGHWRTTPVPLAFHQGDFSAEELNAITAAADAWNAFFTASQGITVLDYGAAGNARTSSAAVPGNVCAQGILQGTSFNGQVVIYKQSTWPHPGTVNSTIALTTFCTTPGAPTPQVPLPSTYMAYMEVNAQGFFSAGRKVPDLQTIILHEFGHLLGLLHSCDSGTTKPGMPDCQKPELKQEFSEAVMFPVFGFNEDATGEQRRELTSNDQGRANCLYQKK